MDAYIYVRFSTAQQEQGSSRERQLADCRAFVERMGWREVGPPIEDLGRSAWKGDHLKSGQLGKFAKRLHDGLIPPNSVLVCENLDRLSRQKARVTQRWIEDICDAGLSIATVAGGKVYNADNLNENLLSLLEVLFIAEGANRYAEMLSRRVKGSYEKRLAEARENGTAITTVGPAWLSAVGERPDIQWVPINERVKVVREIFDLTCAGHAPWAIARMLNERPWPSFGGRNWERTSIVKILRNRAVEGDYVVGTGKNSAPTGEVLVGYYGEPVVPLDVVAQARAMLDRRRRGKGRNSGAVNNLFGQKLRCACGGRMMLTGYQSRYLTCYEANRGNGCTRKGTYKYRPFETAALDAILHFALDETFFRQAKKSSIIGLEIAGVEKAIRDKETEANRLVNLLSRIDSPSTEAGLMRAEQRLASLKDKLVALKLGLAQAEGAASADAHLARVHGIRDALNHAEAEVRLPARLRVSEALQGVIQYIECETVAGERRVELSLVGGTYAVRFDNDGKMLARVGGHLDAIMVETGGAAGDIVRRMEQRGMRA